MRIHEDPLVTSRPPRAPKAVPPTEHKMPSVDTSSCQDASSSQGPSSCRSTSSSQAHFLDGFNVEGCFDVRSIPDPPTPQPRNQRRLSSPMVNVRSHLEDVTNQAKEKPSKSHKRTRKSLCHVPSPLEEQREDPAMQHESSAPKTLQVSICMEEDDQLVLSSSKRRKKRQSMVLPKDLVEQHANTFASISPKEEQRSPQKKAFSGDLQSMRELQNMVRGYCSLPLERRDVLAKAIEDSTGYPIRNPIVNKEEFPQNRKLVLQQVYPVIQQMDKRKVEETAFWEQETQCRVEKSRSGRYRYRLIATNTKVGTQEYEKRYMAVLERYKAQRLERANTWKARLRPTSEKEECKPAVSKSPSHSNGMSMEEHDGTDPSSETHELLLNLDSVLDMGQQEEESISPLPIDSPEDDTMELCDLSVSLDMGEATGFSFDHDPSTETSEDTFEKVEIKETDESPEVSVKLDKKTSEKVETMETKQQEDVKIHAKQSSPSDGPLLPFPDRDEESMDPDIARAERKLWNGIDAVLQEYSREVMLIMRAKKPKAEVFKS